MIDTLPGLAKRLAPELGNVYVLTFSQLAGLPLPDTYAFAAAGDTMGAGYVARIPDYRGPGPVIALDVRDIAFNANPGKVDACLLATFLHELAHCLPYRTIDDAPRTSRAVQVHTEALERYYSAPPEVASVTQDPHHDWRWIRRCGHLYWRIKDDYLVYPSDILGYRERLSPLDHYLPLLSAECDRLRDATFDQIESTPPPHGLREYFAADLAFHQGSQQ